MPGASDNVPSDDGIKKIAAKLASLRTAATAPRSWLKRTLNPVATASRQGEFNLALVDAVEKALAVLRETIARQELRLESLSQDLTDLRSQSANLRESQATELAQMRQEQRERIEQLDQEHRERLNHLAAGQSDLGGELRERIQHLLDEQRVCIRQLSLKTSEEAVLAERARRATELRLEELARRIPERPA